MIIAGGGLARAAGRCRNRLRRLQGSDDGSASLEFVVLGVLLLVPLAYLLISVFAVQSAAYGVSAASREAGRAYVQTTAGSEPGDRAFAAAMVALQDHGIELVPEQLTITCSADPCLTPGAVVSIRVDVLVSLPWVPKVFGEAPASVAVHGQHTAVVDRFRPGGGG